jgi:hypothetical protein
MAKKDKKTYEITKEKPAGSLGLLISGGAAGTGFLFLVFLMIGAYAGMGLDNLIFYFMIAGFFGFFFGTGITWLLIRYFGEMVHLSGLAGPVASAPTAAAAAPAEEVMEAPLEGQAPLNPDEEAKGKSVDYVFPEFSPENQS